MFHQLCWNFSRARDRASAHALTKSWWAKVFQKCMACSILNQFNECIHQTSVIAWWISYPRPRIASKNNGNESKCKPCHLHWNFTSFFGVPKSMSPCYFYGTEAVNTYLFQSTRELKLPLHRTSFKAMRPVYLFSVFYLSLALLLHVYE